MNGCNWNGRVEGVRVGFDLDPAFPGEEKMKKVAISAVLLFCTSLPTIAGEPSAEQRREIEGIIQKWADAFNQGDYKQQVSYATNDIEAIGPWGVWIGKEYNLQMTEKTYANLRG